MKRKWQTSPHIAVWLIRRSGTPPAATARRGRIFASWIERQCRPQPRPIAWSVPRYAAIDIGSNSIRMEAAEVVPGLPARILASRPRGHPPRRERLPQRRRQRRGPASHLRRPRAHGRPVPQTRRRRSARRRHQRHPRHPQSARVPRPRVGGRRHRPSKSSPAAKRPA